MSAETTSFANPDGTETERTYVATGTSLPLGGSRVAWVYVATDDDGSELDRIVVIAGEDRPEGELLAKANLCTCGYARHWKFCPLYRPEAPDA